MGCRFDPCSGSLRSHMAHGQKQQNINNRSNIVTNSVETFKKIAAECPVGMRHTLAQWEHVRSNSLQGFFLGQWKCCKINCDGCATLNILKVIELYILNGKIVWHMNYISVKLSHKRVPRSWTWEEGICSFRNIKLCRRSGEIGN